MEDFSRLLVAPKFSLAFEKVLGMLKGPDLISASRVCPEWFEALENRPKLWMPVIDYVQRKRFLVRPDMKLIR